MVNGKAEPSLFSYIHIFIYMILRNILVKIFGIRDIVNLIK